MSHKLEETRQRVCAVGLCLLYFAAALSHHNGMLSSLGLILTSAPLVVAGAVLAAVRRFWVLAGVTVFCSTVVSVFAAGDGAGALLLLAAAAAVGAIGVAVLVWNGHGLLPPAAIAGQLLILVAAYDSGVLYGWPGFVGLGIVWVTAVVSISIACRMGRATVAQLLSVAGAVGCLFLWLLLLDCSVGGLLAAVTLASFAFVLGASATRFLWTVPVLWASALVLGAIVAGLSVGPLGTAAGLVLLVGYLLRLAACRRQPLLADGAMVVCFYVAALMGSFHPAQAPDQFHLWLLWSGICFFTAAVFLWARLTCPIGFGEGHKRLPWYLLSGYWVGILAGLSNIVVLYGDGRIMLTVTWAICGLAAAVFFRKNKRQALCAQALLVVAIAKLALLDWYHLESGPKIGVVAAFGAALFLLPLTRLLDGKALGKIEKAKGFLRAFWGLEGRGGSAPRQ